MNKLALAAAVSAVLASPTFAAAAAYTGTAKSGTAANGASTVGTVNDAIQVTAGATTYVWYVNTASGTASNKTAPAIQMNVASDWTFDFSNLAAVTFTGNIQYGTNATQTSVVGTPTIDGRYTVNNALQTMSGVGSFNAATNTFTYSFLNSTVNGGGASVGTNSGGNICANGATSTLGKVCASATAASPSWEGLALNFVFSADKSTFAGTLQATDTSGTGLTANTTKVNWQVSGNGPAAPTVPVPAAAWLFGSGLVGLAGTARRRSKKA